jgi:ABC-type sugar transport system substrate-binding protein
MGAQHPTQPLLSATRKDGVPLIGLDPVPLITGTLHLGIPDTQAGMMAGNFLGPILKHRLQTDWKGRNLIYLGMSYVPCDACEKRVLGALAALRHYVAIPDSNVIISRSAANIDQNRAFAANVLTAHPNDVFTMVGLNDEWGIGAYEAFVGATRTKDMIGSTVGCDSAGVGALRNTGFAGMDLGCVDANPYAEGWNWIEAAIATAQHESFKPYAVHRIVTPANVNKAYPKS